MRSVQVCCDSLVMRPVRVTRPWCGMVAGARVSMLTRSGVSGASSAAVAGAHGTSTDPAAAAVARQASSRSHAGRVTRQG